MATWLAFATLTLCLLQPTIGLGDELIFKNGDRLTGEILRMEDGKITFDSANLGELGVSASDLEAFRTDEKVEIYMNDGTFVSSRVEHDESGEMRIESEASDILHLESVDRINPEKPRWKGNLVVGVNVERGDTDKNQVDAELEAGWRDELWRYSFRFLYEGERSRSSGSDYRTTDRLYSMRTQLDRFLGEKLFVYGRLRGESDGPADLDLRTILGGGIGYQIFDRSDLELFVQSGLAWVREDYSDGSQDTDYPAGVALWNLRRTLNPWTRFFHHGEWVPSLRDFEDVQILTTETGLRFELIAGWFTEAKVRFELDTEPAPGKERRNTKYILGLGWGF